MTRFSASGPRIRYTPTEGLKPFKQIVGLYNTWQSLSPETRKWFADLFKGKDEPAKTVEEIKNPELIMAGYDPSLETPMADEEPAGWDQGLLDYGSNMIVGLPVEVGNKVLVPEAWDAPIISREDAGETTYQAWGAL